MGKRREARERVVQFLFQYDLNAPDNLDEALGQFWESQRAAAIALEKGRATWGQPVELPPPTKEELATLIRPEENRLTGLYIDPAFDKQRNCWSSTTGNHHQVCYADFYYGDLYLIEENYANHFVRAVRNG